MNIVHLQLSGGIGGISVLSRDIAEISKHNNIFYFLFEGGVIADQLKDLGSTVVVKNYTTRETPAASKELVEFCKQNNVDVVICHTGSPVTRFAYIYCQKHYKKAKYLLYLHANAHDGIYRNKLKQFITSKLTKKAHQISSTTVAISNTVKNSYIQVYDFDNSKCKTIYNGINLDKFYSNKIEKQDDCFNIIFVGRLFAAKGIHLLVNAIAKLPKDIKINVKIVGKDQGGYGEQCKNNAKQLGIENIVEFTGPKLNVPELLAESDLFVHPAICEEGFGIAVVEAMASYIPCIAFNKGAMPEIIDNDINGYLVDDEKSQALSDAILKAYNKFQTDEYKNMRLEARKKAETFSIKNYIKELEKLY